MQSTGQQDVALVIRDLIFETKIKATAAALGVNIHVARSGVELSRLLETVPLSRVIVDLNSAGPAAFEAIEAARQAGAYIIAYVAHVDTALAAQACDAGADEVLPRSRFAAQLPALLIGAPADESK